jgi:NAD(P)-dependent dehydrogenase (short-subunit alcohol dehydrogenase family)
MSKAPVSRNGRRARQDGRLAGKVALVTGAGRGIGLATTECFAAEGARVVAVELDFNRVSAARKAAGRQGRAARGDVTSAAQVRQLVADIEAQYGRLDILVCNAGRPYEKGSLSATDEDWDECIKTNLQSAWICAREAHPLLKAAGGGGIINIASTQAYRSTKTSFPYSVAKGGLMALTRSLAVEYAPDKIRVNAIVPGQIESARTAGYFDSFADPREARRRVLSTFPLGRLGRPEDVAKAAAFLASDDAEWITATHLVVDGGRDGALVDLSDLK